MSTKPQPSLNEKIGIAGNIEPLSETPSEKEEAQENVRKSYVQTSSLDNGVEIPTRAQPSPNLCKGMRRSLSRKISRFPHMLPTKRRMNRLDKMFKLQMFKSLCGHSVKTMLMPRLNRKLV